MLLIRGVTDGAEAGQECCSSTEKGVYWRDPAMMTSGVIGLLVFQIHTKHLQVLERGRHNPDLFNSTTAFSSWQGLPSTASYCRRASCGSV